MNLIVAFIKLARPKQWVKNIFVFTALIFAGLITSADSIQKILIAFAAFCIASSSVYFLNDYKDMQEDKLHPKKKHRPLANGDLPRMVGLIGFVIFAIGSTLLAYFTLGLSSFLVLATYLIINLGYSLGLKHLVIIDVLLISSGFVLRILAGATALSVMPSNWLIMCGVTISLFLGFTKRRAEVVSLGEKAKNHRRVLAQYNVAFLDQIISIVTGATLVFYILYTFDDHTVDMVGSRLLVFSVPFVIYGIFRYLFLVYHTKLGGDPTRTIFTDKPLLVTGVLWTVLCTSAILFGSNILAFFA